MRAVSMRVYILENNVRNYFGHFFNTVAGLRTALDQAKVASRIYIHQQAEPEVGRQLAARPLFPDHFWESEQAQDAEQAMATYGQRFAEALAHVEPPNASDWLVVTTAFQDQVFGLAAYLETLAPAERPRVLCYLHWANWQQHPSRQRAWQRACDRIAPHRATFAAQTEGIATQFQQLTGQPASLWPVPMNYGDPGAISPRPGRSPARVAVLGRSLHRKGSHLLPEIIVRTQLRHPWTRFYIQVSDNMPKLRHVRHLPGVSIGSGDSRLEAHLQTVREADLLLLPYCPDDYRQRSSGLLMEAAALGRAVVVPDGTWLAAQIADGRAAGTVFTRQQAPEIAQALGQALGMRSQLAHQAREAASYWWEHQSAGTFVQRLLAAQP